ncbi:hypothetical protein FRZ59_07525 [Anseongella ginsenosidimutans]|nr:hypothetical protein FRZ59_07525 [Anseongella ginsenosidimutans]
MLGGGTLLAGGTFLAGGALLSAGCGRGGSSGTPEKGGINPEEGVNPGEKAQEETAAADPCEDFSQLSSEELKAREKLGYEEESPIPDRQCANCNLWLPPKDGEKCGGCTLFKGPVYAAAYCTYWAPQV